MARSKAITGSRLQRIRTPQNQFVDEQYILNGLNQSTPDALVANNEVPVALNCRMFARRSTDKRVSIQSRKGPGFYSIPINEAVDQQQTSATGATDQTINTTNWIAQKFTAGVTKRLTMVQVQIKKNTGVGPVICAIYTDAAGSPGTKVATSGINGSSINSTYGYLSFRFIEAPALVSGTSYWVILYSQDDAMGLYAVESTTNTTLAKTSNNSGGTWTPQSWSINYKTYCSDANPPLGATRRYDVNGTKETHFVAGTTWYKINDADGTTSVVKSGLNANATVARFAHFNNKTVMVNGFDGAIYYDGTTTGTLSGLPFTPNNIIAHQNRLFFTTATDPTRVFFSDLANENSYPSVNFFYVPSPKSSDPITAWQVQNANLVIFTYKNKYVLTGTDISNFALRQSLGNKGAISQEATAYDRNIVYFVSTDGPYAYTGAQDEYLGDKIQPEFDGITAQNTIQLRVWRNQLRLYYAPTGSAVNSKMLLWDLVYQQWFMDDMAYCVFPLVFVQDTQSPLVEFSSLVGAAYYGEQDYSVLGAPYYFKYWTTYKQYVSAAAKTRVKKFHPQMRPATSTYVMQIGEDIDFQGSPIMQNYTVSATGSKWGDGVSKWGDGVTKWGSSQLVDAAVDMAARGKHTQYRFERYGCFTPVQLYGYIALLKSSRLK